MDWIMSVRIVVKVNDDAWFVDYLTQKWLICELKDRFVFILHSDPPGAGYLIFIVMHALISIFLMKSELASDDDFNG